MIFLTSAEFRALIWFVKYIYPPPPPPPHTHMPHTHRDCIDDAISNAVVIILLHADIVCEGFILLLFKHEIYNIHV